ncbi:universal stress protein [Streptomyces sp. NPDC088757]|uniref:universal stress protein n=1 Tax=Streptomyces sp. NPDC088757 TaxID=3365889 RepID=UPI003814B1BC
MTRSIVIGPDGTERADAAAERAAEEAEARGTGVFLVHVREPSPGELLPFVAREPVGSWAEELLARTHAPALRERRPGLPVAPRPKAPGPDARRPRAGGVRPPGRGRPGTT